MDEAFEYDVFLSFSSEDQDDVKPIWQKLCISGLRVFWSDSSLKSNVGQLWFDVIQNSLVKSRHFVLVCSKNSMNSEWVRQEYQTFYSQCFLKASGLRRMILKIENNFDSNLLPPFLKNLQTTRSVDDIVSSLGGINIQMLKLELDHLKRDLQEERLEKQRITQELDALKRISTDKSLEQSNLIKKLKEYESKTESLADTISQDRLRQPNIDAAELFEPCEEVSSAVEKAIVEIRIDVSTGSVKDLNSQAVADKLFKTYKGREITELMNLLGDPQHDWQVRWKAIKLLSYSVCQRDGRSLALQALEAICNSFGSDERVSIAALEAVSLLPVSRSEKWKQLFAILYRARAAGGSKLVEQILAYTPPGSREETGDAVFDILVTANIYLAETCLSVLRGLNYRKGIPDLRSIILSTGEIARAARIAELLSSWRDRESAPAIRAGYSAVGKWRLE